MLKIALMKTSPKQLLKLWWSHNSVEEHLPSMWKALTLEGRQEGRKINMVDIYLENPDPLSCRRLCL